MKIKGQSAAKLLNVKFGTCKIIDDKFYTIKGRKSLLTKCTICNEQSFRRLDHLYTIPKYCKFCKDKKVGEKKAKPDSTINSLLTRYITMSKNRNHNFELSKEYFIELINSNCYYCNAKPIETLSSKHTNRSNIPVFHNGIDRLNSNLGYIKDNVVPCCITCNIMKNKFDKDTFFNQIIKIYNIHLKECSTTIP